MFDQQQRNRIARAIMNVGNPPPSTVPPTMQGMAPQVPQMMPAVQPPGGMPAPPAGMPQVPGAAPGAPSAAAPMAPQSPLQETVTMR